MKAKVRLRKSEDDRVYVVKTEKFITQEEMENLRTKQEKSKTQRKEKVIQKNIKQEGVP